MNTHQATQVKFDSILGFSVFWVTSNQWKMGFNHVWIKGKGLMVKLCGDKRKLDDFGMNLF